jgi:hypothetical protein
VCMIICKRWTFWTLVRWWCWPFKKKLWKVVLCTVETRELQAVYWRSRSTEPFFPPFFYKPGWVEAEGEVVVMHSPFDGPAVHGGALHCFTKKKDALEFAARCSRPGERVLLPVYARARDLVAAGFFSDGVLPTKNIAVRKVFVRERDYRKTVCSNA